MPGDNEGYDRNHLSLTMKYRSGRDVCLEFSLHRFENCTLDSYSRKLIEARLASILASPGAISFERCILAIEKLFALGLCTTTLENTRGVRNLAEPFRLKYHSR